VSDVLLIIVCAVGLFGWGYAFSAWRRRRRRPTIDTSSISETVAAIRNAQCDGAFDSVEEARRAVAGEPGSCAIIRGGLDVGGPGTCIGCGAAVGDLEVCCGQPGCPATAIGGSK
jgi:hypothetical protein